MKTTNDKNQIWFQTEVGITKIGFTKPFLDSLDQCWHILPANMKQFKQKAPLLIVETNDSLISIASPIDGNLIQHEQDAINFPDHLTEESVIMTLSSQPALHAAAPVPRAPQVPEPPIEWENPAIRWNPGNLVNGGAMLAPPVNVAQQEAFQRAVAAIRDRAAPQRAVQDDMEQF